MNKINTLLIILLLYFQNLTMIMKNQEASFSYFKYFEKKSMYKLDSSNKDNLPSSSSGYMVLDREREVREKREKIWYWWFQLTVAIVNVFYHFISDNYVIKRIKMNLWCIWIIETLLNKEIIIYKTVKLTFYLVLR